MPVLDIVASIGALHELEDVVFNGQSVDVLVNGIVVEDGRAYISGNINDHTSEVFREFFAELDAAEIEKISGMASGSTTNSKIAIAKPHMAEIVDNILTQRPDTIVVSDGETFGDVRAAVKNKITTEAAPPKIETAPEPEGPKSANLVEGQAIRIQDYSGDGPTLIEGFDVNGSSGDMVVHDIEFSGGKPFLTGVFSVQTDTGSVDREFAVAIDSSRFPDVTALTNDNLRHLTSPEVVQEMLASKQHDIVLSAHDAFPDRARLLSDIKGLQGINQGAYHADIPYLARMGQEYPELLDTMKLYQNSWSPFGRNDELIKMTIIDHLDIQDPKLRSLLVDNTASMREFAETLNSRTDLFSKGPETRAAISHMAAHADNIVGEARPKSLGKVSAAARLFGGAAVVGTMANAASAGVIAYEGSSMLALTEQQLAAGDITELQYDALMKFHAETTGAQVADASVGMADQFIIPSAMFTVGVELRARGELTRISTLLDIPEDIYQMHARSMFGGHTASHTAILAATDELPRSPEGQPDILHYAIALKAGMEMAENDLMVFQSPYISMTIPDDIRGQIEAREQAIASMKSSLVEEMGSIMRSPEGSEAFLNVMSVDDRLDFVRSIAMVDDTLDANNPLVADLTRDYMNLPLDEQIEIGNAMFAATEALSADNGAMLNAYIISRIMSHQDGASHEMAGVDLTDDGNFTGPDAAAAGDVKLLGAAAGDGLMIRDSLVVGPEIVHTTPPSTTPSVAPS